MNLRGLLGAAVGEILPPLSRLLPRPRVIYDREGGSPYLSRWYLVGERPEGEHFNPSEEKPPRDFNLFLHKFHRSDDDGLLHSHPWEWAVSFVLVGGYSEERRVGDEVVRRDVLPFSFNVLRAVDYHRVDLFEGREAWSLFFVGPRVGTWFFWDRDKKVCAQWREYIDEKREGKPAKWVKDVRVSTVSG